MAKQKSAGNRQGLLIIGAVVVAVAVLAVAVVLSQNSTGETVTLDESFNYAGIPIGGRYADARTVELTANVAEGVERGINEDGIPYIGNPNAPIVLGEWLDFTCIHCANYHAELTRIIRDFARTGDVQIQIYFLPASTRAPESQNAARAGICAAEQGGFWEMHDELFRVHLASSYNEFGTVNDVVTIGESIGLDGSKLRECINSNRADEAILNSNRMAREYSLSATPSVMYRTLNSDRWNNISEQRSYDQIAALIASANANKDEG